MKFRFLILLLIVLCPLLNKAQSQPEHYYVTIGVFRIHDHAIGFTDKANKLNFNAQYAIHPERKLYFVYLLDTEDKKKASDFVAKIRTETEFKTAWVYRGNLGDEQTVVAQKEPVPEVVKEPVKIEEPKKEEPIEAPKAEEPKAEAPKVEEPIKEPIVEQSVAKADSSLIEKEPGKKPEGKPFFFKLVDSESGQEVIGEVHLFTSAKATQYQSFPVNKIVYLKAPTTGVIQVSTVAAGYREMKRAVNYNDPAASAAEVGAQQEAIVSFPLVKVKLGDYIEFSNVRFFSNTAIFQPESKNELNGLVDLMKENTKYKIKVHGHCNGNKDRDIISKGSSAEFFATDASNLKEKASAKRLTELRAELVKEYLVSQGIEADRITTKGEGGKTMIYPQNSTLSGRNDRVEIEVAKGR